MPKRFLRRILPKPEVVRNHRHMRIFGTLLHSPNLWHLNRRSVSRAVAIGLFTCFIPIPFQMVLAAAIAIVLRANILISVVLVWISNPFTMPPMFYFSYKLGAWLLDMKPIPINFEFTIKWFTEKVYTIWAPLYLGSMICAIVSAILGYILIQLIWRVAVIIQHRKRKHRTGL